MYYLYINIPFIIILNIDCVNIIMSSLVIFHFKYHCHNYIIQVFKYLLNTSSIGLAISKSQIENQIILGLYLIDILIYTWASLMAQMVKNLPAMLETWVWFLSWEDPLEKGRATHFSILAWRIPWTEGPGELQSIGSQSYYCIIAAMTLIIWKSVLHICHIFSHNLSICWENLISHSLFCSYYFW